MDEEMKLKLLKWEDMRKYFNNKNNIERKWSS